jgi:DNA-binding response OmpR family regulator
MAMFPAAQPVKTLTPYEGFRSRVLVIDDEPLIRWALTAGLSAAGFDTDAAATAEEAAAMARRWPPPEVILMDLHRDDCSGTIVDLQRAAPHCQVLVLGTCCSGRRESRWRGFEVIPKPFDLEDVIERVRASISRSSPGR